MLEDLIRMTWGTAPTSTAGLYLAYGQVRFLGATIPTYNLIVIAASVAIAAGLGWLLTRTVFGRIVRAAAENREMAEALNVLTAAQPLVLVLEDLHWSDYATLDLLVALARRREPAARRRRTSGAGSGSSPGRGSTT